MYYNFELSQIPVVKQIYSVTRNTVWETADIYNIIVLIIKGKCEFIVEGETFVAEEGDVVYIPENCSYVRRHIDSEMCTMKYLHFTLPCEINSSEAKELRESIQKLRDARNEQLLYEHENGVNPRIIYIQNHNRVSDTNVIKNFIDGINLFSSEREIMCDMQSALNLCHILAYISHCNIVNLQIESNHDERDRIPPKLKKAIRYIRSHYSEPITLGELAEYCCVSKQQITRYFNDEFGTAPVNYIIEYKISKAKNMLFRNQGLTVKQIAYELGFADQHYFSRIFKKVTGETPMQYRDRTTHYVSPKAD